MRWHRPDGRPAPGLPAYRRMVPFLMRGRNEAAVYFEQTVDLSSTLPWLEQQGERGGRKVGVFPLVLTALGRVLHERPRLNRFVAGRRIHDRHGVFLSFAAKTRMDDDAPLTVIKREFAAGQTFDATLDVLARDVARARGGHRSLVDREVELLLRLPPVVLDGLVRAFRFLDHVGLAPRAMIASDPMYTSAFVANLGSIQLDAAFHHLYEHGNCPLFVTVGTVERAPHVDADGQLRTRPSMKLRFTFDERIEDGLYCARSLDRLRTYLQEPASWALPSAKK